MKKQFFLFALLSTICFTCKPAMRMVTMQAPDSEPVFLIGVEHIAAQEKVDRQTRALQSVFEKLATESNTPINVMYEFCGQKKTQTIQIIKQNGRQLINAIREQEDAVKNKLESELRQRLMLYPPPHLAWLRNRHDFLTMVFLRDLLKINIACNQ